MLNCWSLVSRSGQRCLLTASSSGLRRQMAVLSTSEVNPETSSDKDGEILSKNILSSIHPKMSRDEMVDVMTRLRTEVPVETARPLVEKALNTDQEDSGDVQKLRGLLSQLENLQVVQNLEAKGIISCLKSANHLGLDSNNSKAVQTLENRLTWKARNVPMKELPYLLSYAYKSYKDMDTVTSDSQGSTTSVMFSEVVRVVEARWVEVDSAELLTAFLHFYPKVFSEQYIQRLEDRAMDMSEQLTGVEIVNVLKVLGQKKRRSVPLVRKLTYHLEKRLIDLDLRTFCDILYTLNQLSFKSNGTILSEACYEAEKLIDLETDGAAISSLLTSLGQLKMQAKPLLNKIAVHLLQKLTSDDPNHKVSDRELFAFTLTTATVNYKPKDSEHLFEIIMQRITPEKVKSFGAKHDLLWLDFVWSLCILNKATPELLTTVLSPEFYNKIIYSQYNRTVGSMLKVLNVNGYASLVCTPNYSGPRLTFGGNSDSEHLLADVRGPVSPDKRQILQQVMDAMASLASGPAFMATDVNTGMGFNVQGEVVFDKNLKPLKIEPYKILNQQSAAGNASTPIPDDSSRVALMVVGYHDCLLGGNDLSGLTDLYVRLLEAKGFKVLIVKHSDIKPKEKTLDRVKMIQKKLQTLLGKH